jgi:AbiV family abortive infection protein
MKKKLDQYRGRLTPEAAAAGMNAATSNALRLAEEAEMLLNAEHFPSAASLAALSIEESGKVSILRALVLARDNKELEDAWREYRTHTKKNVMWLLPSLVAGGARKLDDFAPLYAEESDHPHLLDQVKQLGFYTDCLGKCHWAKPAEVANPELAKSLVRAAKVLARHHEVTVREVKLWIEHIAPHWKTTKERMELALVQWNHAMVREGLMNNAGIEKFITEGIHNQQQPGS